MRLIVPMVLAAALLAPAANAASPNGYKERNSRAICVVFKQYCGQALRVATCESGLTVTARNGQYLGLFQMGSYARARYGHHYHSPWVQARAAFRYFLDSGRDWSPWACKPW